MTTKKIIRYIAEPKPALYATHEEARIAAIAYSTALPEGQDKIRVRVRLRGDARFAVLIKHATEVEVPA